MKNIEFAVQLYIQSYQQLTPLLQKNHRRVKPVRPILFPRLQNQP